MDFLRWIDSLHPYAASPQPDPLPRLTPALWACVQAYHRHVCRCAMQDVPHYPFETDVYARESWRLLLQLIEDTSPPCPHTD